MRITVVCPQYPPMPGGVSDYARRWALAIAERGETVTVVTSPGATAEPPLRLEASQSDWGARGLGSLLEKVLASKPDVVLLHYVPHLYERRGASVSANLLAARLRLRGIPVVTLAHELYYGRHEGLKVQPFGAWQRAMLLPLFWGSARVVLTVPDRLARMRKLFPCWAKRFTLIPVGGNLEPVQTDRADWRARHGVPEDALLLLFMGLAHPSKELDSLLAALETLAREGLPARLAVVGGGRVEHPHALNLGFLPEAQAAEALAAADLFLLPLADGASTRRTSLMNALAAGLPVVSTTGTNTDAALFAGALKLVSAGDAQAFAAATLALARDAQARQALGEAGQQLYASRFSWKVLADSWLRLLGEVAKREAPSLVGDGAS